MKFLNFMEKRIDPFLYMMLADLGQTLSKDPELEVNFSYHSVYRPSTHSVSISHYWNRLNEPSRIGGMKSDVYLKAFGQVNMTDFEAVKDYEHKRAAFKWTSFSLQLFAMLEDFRIEEAILQQRPGMIYAFQDRRTLLIRRFREGYQSAKKTDAPLDLLFSGIYLQWTDRPVVFPERLAIMKPKVRLLLSHMKDTTSTADVAELCLQFLSEIPTDFRDMTGSYFTIEPDKSVNNNVILEQRKDEVDGAEKKKDKEQEEENDETLPTWHEEDEEDLDAFLQYDLNKGQKTDLMGDAEREADSGDQAFGSVEGSAQSSDQKDYDNKENKKMKPENTPHGAVEADPSGKANRHAKAIFLKAAPSVLEEQLQYQAYKSENEPVERALKRTIQKTIEQKKIAPRESLQAGRLGKKLLKILTEENPRLFYKKNQESDQLDVAFSLLVDCSASMYDKMAELKSGLVLFHETLNSLKIPHEITGFYEDALDSDDNEQPNYFQTILSYEQSLLPQSGTSIMQLTPEEDNRDGFAIRIVGEKLKKRSEKHKLLLVFTDGEPSAHNYNDEGIVDTQEAVIHMRRSGIEVIGIFLANEEIPHEREVETMHAIYGEQSLIIPTITDIPVMLRPLLKKLLIKYI